MERNSTDNRQRWSFLVCMWWVLRVLARYQMKHTLKGYAFCCTYTVCKACVKNSILWPETYLHYGDVLENAFHFHLKCKCSKKFPDKIICPADVHVEVLMEVVQTDRTPPNYNLWSTLHESESSPLAAKTPVSLKQQHFRHWCRRKELETVQRFHEFGRGRGYWRWSLLTVLISRSLVFAVVMELGAFVKVSKCRCVKTHSCECRPLSGDSRLSAWLGSVLHE